MKSILETIKERELCFYDIETFYNYSCWVFWTKENGFEVIEFGTNKEENLKATKKLVSKYRDILSKYILVGYNCKKYDNLILLSLFEHMEPELVTPQLINDYSSQIICDESLKWVKIPDGFLSYDVYNFQNHMPSLKIVGTLFGGDIRETPISFSYRGTFTKEQINEIVKYCKHDVEITRLIFESELGQKYFNMENKMAQIAIEEINTEARKKAMFQLYSTTCCHFEEIVKHNTQGTYRATNDSYLDEFLLKKPDVVESVMSMIPTRYREKYSEVVNFFYSRDMLSTRGRSDGREGMKYELELRDDVTVSYGAGGAHGTVPYPLFVASSGKYKILHADFSAMYPSIMIAYDMFPPQFPEKLKAVFKKFAEARDEFKRAGDKDSSDAYKPILNSVPGRFRYQFSRMFHPATNFSICAFGQTMITAMSCMMVGRLIQIDTDGIMVCCRDFEYEENVSRINEFSKRIGLKIKVEQFNWFAQQNIHAYAFEDECGNVDGIGGIMGGKSDWEPNLRGIADVVHRCLKSGRTVRECLVDHIKENGISGLCIVSKTTAKFHAFEMQDFKTGQITEFENRFLLSVAVIGTKAVNAGLKPVSITKIGDGKIQKIASFPNVVCNINRLSDELPLDVIDLNYYTSFIESKTNGILGLCGIKEQGNLEYS